MTTPKDNSESGQITSTRTLLTDQHPRHIAAVNWSERHPKPLSRTPSPPRVPTCTFQTPKNRLSFAGKFLRFRHNHLERRMFALRTKRREGVPGGTPTPPPKFAVFHKKIAGNSTIKVRPIESATVYVDENLLPDFWKQTNRGWPAFFSQTSAHSLPSSHRV
jgi:hypothetical protein